MLIGGQAVINSISPIYRVIVNFGISIEELSETGNYCNKNDEISSLNYPTTGKGSVPRDLVLVNFGRHMMSIEVIAELFDNGFRTASVRELLSLGIAYPSMQMNHPIVALRESWNGHVVRLTKFGSARYLQHAWLAGHWFEEEQFLAVKS